MTDSIEYLDEYIFSHRFIKIRIIIRQVSINRGEK